MNVIAENFKQGDNCKIGHFCVISEDVVIGNNVTIGHHTILHPGIHIGDNSVVGSFCELGKGIVIGKQVTIQGRIRVGNECKIEDGATIKYGTILTSNVLLKRNSFLGPNVITLGSTHKRVEVLGTEIGENTYIGAGSKIAGGILIGNDIVIGAMSFVNRNIAEKGLYVGIPIKKVK